ncbi:MAG: hypothetical protein HGB28_04525 [Oscillochloris sp.]|nr:hypothetical protein [Oscillochloris sp.]
MHIRLTCKPGQPGTLSELATYGDKLVCVRYRYDEATHKRHKTVELIIETVDWHPPPPPMPPETIVYVRIERHETELHTQLKQARAAWNPQIKRWRLRYDTALSLGLEDRIDWEIRSQRQ